jgi:hypothetical protein
MGNSMLTTTQLLLELCFDYHCQHVHWFAAMLGQENDHLVFSYTARLLPLHVHTMVLCVFVRVRVCVCACMCFRS